MKMPLALALIVTTAAGAQTARRRAVAHPSSPVVVRQAVVLAAARDNTLYETSDGSLSNGAGPYLFAGTTAGAPGRRRALIAFDLRGIPPGSLIVGASLRVNVSRTISATHPLALHALTAGWGEGTSNTNWAEGGAGAPSAPGDATWIHRFSPSDRWSTAGGDFASAPDAIADAGDGPVTWNDARLIARVQQWVDQPASNFGWIIIGNESLARTAKRLDSRESTGATSPSLAVEFIPRQ